MTPLASPGPRFVTVTVKTTLLPTFGLLVLAVTSILRSRMPPRLRVRMVLLKAVASDTELALTVMRVCSRGISSNTVGISISRRMVSEPSGGISSSVTATRPSLKRWTKPVPCPWMLRV